jgi:putative ABC transport system substrate-binding protein
MRRREFISLLGGTAAWPLAARAQQAGAVSSRVAYLALVTGRDSAVVKQRLDELGYAESKNFVFDLRSAEGRSERLPELAAELVRTNPDVIVAGFGTLTAKAAQAATGTLPIVFVSVGDPIGAGIVKSLNRPGGNVTGVTPQGTEMGGKRLQILEEIVPSVQILAVLTNPETPFSMLALRELKAAADTRGKRVVVFEIRSADQLSRSIEAAAKAGATGLAILEDPLLLGLRRQIADLATELRLPTIYGNREFAEAGGLLSYGPDRRQLYRRAAELIDKILKGAKPADIPVEQPTKFEFVINLKAARALRLNVPDRVLALADEVIE